VAAMLFSQYWYKIADLRPRLRIHAQIHRHFYRDQEWYILQDHTSGKFHRFSPEAYQVIGLMDGKRTVEEIWQIACEKLGDSMPPQDEVVDLLSQLHRIDVLQTDLPPDVADLHERHQRQKKNIFKANLRSPMSLRFPLLDPDRFLARTLFLVRPILGPIGAILWISMVVSALVLVFVNWTDLTSNITDQILSTKNLLLLWLVYPLVKGLHEFGHGYMVKRWGGEVHEMGIMFLVLMPIPYVDASSSSAFREKHKRILVGGAGILVELFLASIATMIWVSVEPGLVRALAYNVMLIAGISTLLFNGNPLLRFDGYYILADLLEIPNLGGRSNGYLGYLCQRYLLGIKEATSPASAPGEATWFFFYAVAAFIYRIFISIRIILFIAGKFFVIGILLAMWTLFSFLVMPLYKGISAIVTNPLLKKQRYRIIAICSLIATATLLLLLLVPIPYFTIAQGIVWAPEQSRLHALSDGFVTKVLAEPGTPVAANAPLIRCENPELVAEVTILEVQLKEYKVRRQASRVNDLIEAEIINDEIGRIRNELHRARERQEELLIRSPAAGVLILPMAEDLPGFFLKKGTPIGHVIDFDKTTVRVVVTQDAIDKIRRNTNGVEARLAADINRVIPATLERQMPSAGKDIPSLAFSPEGGGTFPLDPRSPDSPLAMETLFQFDIVLGGERLERIGERVYIRFIHDAEPMFYRWYRTLRRVLLRRFDF
jgi:putative peptide zinc metalloprotease protein